MKRTLLTYLVLIAALAVSAQEGAQPQQREFPGASLAIKTALEQLGAYQGARLPTLEGFIKADSTAEQQYQRPYYEFKIELITVSPQKTQVRVKANVSAWYADPQGTNSGYKTLESNGHLETDLLDRLSDYLQNKGAPLVDPIALARQIEAVRKRREETERHIAELEKHPAAAPAPAADSRELVTITKPQAILSSPDEHATVLLRAQAEDVFEILDRQGDWLHVALEGSQSGWVKASAVASTDLPATMPSLPTSPPPESESFSVIREMASKFTGDWAPLNGKQALYVWARPEGSPLNVMADKKLRFAETIFKDRFHNIDPSSPSPVAGVVVIFLDQAGGVAAASMDDISLWTKGSLSQSAFVKKCSLDPLSAFALKPAQN
jgi:hypothetical protein